MQGRNYWCIRAGSGASLAEYFHKGGYIAIGWDKLGDLSAYLTDTREEFDKTLRPKIIELYSDTENKIKAGYATGIIYNFCMAMQQGDIVLLPRTAGGQAYYIGEITGNYFYAEPLKGKAYPHRRPVKWLKEVRKDALSKNLHRCLSYRQTLWNISQYGADIEKLLNGKIIADNDEEAEDNETVLTTNDKTIKNPVVFALENHLEEFLVKNWHHTEFGKTYEIYQGDDALIGRQYRTKAGIIDILAKSKDSKEILIIELKKGRTSDKVVGQILRYIGYAEEELLERGQTVRGCIIASEEDESLRYALQALRGRIDFCIYEIDFKLKRPYAKEE